MKLVVASDIHGAASWCARLVEAVAVERPDRVVLLGDLLYHGPRNDVPADYDPRSVIAQLSGIADRIIAVRGNCEAEVDQMVLPFACMADYNVLYDPDADRNLFATHGHVYGPGLHNSVARLPTLATGTAVVYGHTHIKVNRAATPDEVAATLGAGGTTATNDGEAATNDDLPRLWLFNPGSVGIPKDGTHSYGVYENGAFALRELK